MIRDKKSLKIPKGGNQNKIPKGGNQNLYIKEEQTTQWPKEKVQKVKQSTKHTHKTKDRVILRIGINISSCNLFPNPINYFLLCNVYS